MFAVGFHVPSVVTEGWDCLAHLNGDSTLIISIALVMSPSAVNTNINSDQFASDLNLTILGLGVEYPPFSLGPEALETLANRFYKKSIAWDFPVRLNLIIAPSNDPGTYLVKRLDWSQLGPPDQGSKRFSPSIVIPVSTIAPPSAMSIIRWSISPAHRLSLNWTSTFVWKGSVCRSMHARKQLKNGADGLMRSLTSFPPPAQIQPTLGSTTTLSKNWDWGAGWKGFYCTASGVLEVSQQFEPLQILLWVRPSARSLQECWWSRAKYQVYSFGRNWIQSTRIKPFELACACSVTVPRP